MIKKIILVISIVLANSAALRAQEPSVEPTAYEMIQNLQRVIKTSTNPYHVAEAERLIREVYGPAYNQTYWSKVKFALKATGVVVGTVAWFAIMFTLLNELSASAHTHVNS